MPVPVIDCRTLSVSLTLNNFSHQMKSNYITTTQLMLNGFLCLFVHIKIYIGQSLSLFSQYTLDFV